MNTSDIEQVAQILNQQNINYWLIGGRAIDLLLGFVSRPHKDIDFFVLAADYDLCRQHLLAAGFAILPQTDREEGVFVQKEEIVVDITKVHVDDSGSVQTYGIYADVPWPGGLLTSFALELDNQTVTTLQPGSHVAMKKAVAAWYAQEILREEDENDIRLMRGAGLIP